MHKLNIIFYEIIVHKKLDYPALNYTDLQLSGRQANKLNVSTIHIWASMDVSELVSPRTFIQISK